MVGQIAFRDIPSFNIVCRFLCLQDCEITSTTVVKELSFSIMPLSIKYNILLGLIVFTGTCMFLLESIALPIYTRVVKTDLFCKNDASVSTHDVREQSHLINFHVNEYNITDEALEMISYTGKNNSTSLVRLRGLSKLLSLIKPYAKQDNKLKHMYLPHKHVFQNTRMVADVNCNAIFQGDKTEIKRADNTTQVRKFLQPQNYLAMTKNCSNFIHERGYIDHHLTEVERDFPIAFSIIMFTDIEQSERLLRAIYRPQNYYCIHVDSKTNQTIYDGMSSIASCFDNVFVTSKRFDVQWGTMTTLEPELLCMKELWNKSTLWKYFINLTGQEFPLRTNYELVRILEAYNGSNDVDGTVKR
ncbi:hypothetical protein DPMN_118450 [Dreissena polymorpha]|uniref:Uncharacterized protein n=1 Tax=Dreissena polymorpha TaxID=45954 RepID=A0A9D4GGY7_DREPO|nr:hypothetical protein DPMN_118450 [Dreissena polymorpha]